MTRVNIFCRPRLAGGAIGLPMSETFIDDELEHRIDFEAGLLAIAQTPAEKIAAWEELKRLVAQRSPEQIERMEREIFR